MNKKQDVVLRKIDIRSWSSEVTRQHGIQGIPQLWLYDGKKLVTKNPQEVLAWLAR